jgi:hypothetical protein
MGASSKDVLIVGAGPTGLMAAGPVLSGEVPPGIAPLHGIAWVPSGTLAPDRRAGACGRASRATRRRPARAHTRP